MNEERFARKCDYTGKGMNEGWVCGEGTHYFSNEEGLIKHLRSLDYIDSNGVNSKSIENDDELREFFYNDDYHFYTEWDSEEEIQEQGYYYTSEGKEIEL